MSFTPSQTIADRYLTGCVKQNAKDRRQEPETQLVNDKEYYRKVKISKNDHARAYIDKIKHTNKGFHFFVSERRIFEGQPINRAILKHPETIVIQHNISDTTPRKRKYLEQLLQDLRRQYPEAKEVEGNEDEKHGVWAKNNSDKKIILSILKETFGITKGFYFQKKKLCFDVIYTDLYEEDSDINTITLFRAISEAINSESYVYINFVTEFEKKEVGATIPHKVYLGSPATSGGRYVTSQHTIYIWPDTKLEVSTADGLKVYYRYSIFWHEIGHFLKPNKPGYAIYLENYARKLKHMPIRKYDKEHPKYNP